MRLATRIARAGRQDASGDTTAIVPPIVLSTAFAHVPDAKFTYSRCDNPNRSALESALAGLEAARHGLAFASGMAAVTALFHTVQRGEEIVFDRRTYAGTLRLLFAILAPLGVEVRIADLAADDFRATVSPATRVVWLETPTNPLLEIIDIRRVADALAGTRALLAVDNSIATPLYQRPLELGAHVVCHSTSKFLNGHGDVVGGFLATSDDDLAERLRLVQLATGAVPSPFDCYLLLRGLATLDVRMERISATARTLADFLRAHPGVAMASQPPFGGGVVTIELRPAAGATAEATTEAFLARVRLFDVAHGFGSVTSSVEAPAVMSHADFPAELLAAVGVSPLTVRLSIGLEDVDDLRDDLEQALRAADA